MSDPTHTPNPGGPRRRRRRSGRFRPDQRPEHPRGTAEAVAEEPTASDPGQDLARPSARHAAQGLAVKLGPAQVPTLPWLYAELHQVERQAVIETLARHGLVVSEEAADEVIQAIDEAIAPGWAAKKARQIQEAKTRSPLPHQREVIAPEPFPVAPTTSEPIGHETEEPPEVEPLAEEAFAEESETIDQDPAESAEPPPPEDTPRPAPAERPAVTPEALLLEEFLERMEFTESGPIQSPEQPEPSQKEIIVPDRDLPEHVADSDLQFAQTKKSTRKRLTPRPARKAGPRKKSPGDSTL